MLITELKLIVIMCVIEYLFYTEYNYWYDIMAMFQNSLPALKIYNSLHYVHYNFQY